MAEQDELAVERVLMLMRLLGGGGVPARVVGGAVRELRKYVGCSQPVLETKHMRCRACTHYRFAHPVQQVNAHRTVARALWTIALCLTFWSFRCGVVVVP